MSAAALDRVTYGLHLKQIGYPIAASAVISVDILCESHETKPFSSAGEATWSRVRKKSDGISNYSVTATY